MSNFDSIHKNEDLLDNLIWKMKNTDTRIKDPDYKCSICNEGFNYDYISDTCMFCGLIICLECQKSSDIKICKCDCGSNIMFCLDKTKNWPYNTCQNNDHRKNCNY